MSILLGDSGDRWTLSNAVDALAESARGAGTPGLLWMAGILYPSLNLTIDVVQGFLALLAELTDLALPVAVDARGVATLFTSEYAWTGSAGAGSVLLLPLLVIYYRLIVGLAKVSDPERAEATEDVDADPVGKTRLRAAWEAGKGLGLPAFGLWLMLLLLLFVAMLVLVIPVVGLVTIAGLSDFPAVLAGLLVPVVVLLVAYATVLMVINQLALHSLAHNRRGAASALTHAWRLVHASPLSAARATLVDFVLSLSVVALTVAIRTVCGVTILLLPFTLLFVLALVGFAGVARAGFWARAYRALGGLSAEDRVPGLSGSSAAAPR